MIVYLELHFVITVEVSEVCSPTRDLKSLQRLFEGHAYFSHKQLVEKVQ